MPFMQIHHRLYRNVDDNKKTYVQACKRLGSFIKWTRVHIFCFARDDDDSAAANIFQYQ